MTMIEWKLSEVMETHRIKPSELAREMNLSMNSVSNLRGDTMPRLSADSLDNLLNALNQLRIPTYPRINVGDIINHSVTAEEVVEQQAPIENPALQQNESEE